MAQAGAPANPTPENPKGGQSIWGEPFEDEIRPTLKHNARGVVSMANKGPGTNGSQFFILFDKASHLDGLNTVFGKLIGDESTATLANIEAVEVDKKSRPKEKIVIEKVTIHANPLAEWIGATIAIIGRRNINQCYFRIQNSSIVVRREVPLLVSVKLRQVQLGDLLGSEGISTSSLITLSLTLTQTVDIHSSQTSNVRYMTQSRAHLTWEEATTSYDTSGTIWIFQQRCGGSSEIQGLVYAEYVIPL